MRHLLKLISICALAITTVSSAAVLPSNPFENTLKKRQSSGQNSLTVDLGYSVYIGVQNTTTGINNFKGSSPIQANRFGPQCPQSPLSSGTPVNVTAGLSDEDCLYLNVYAPANASSLPVLVWIHGGGYGAGNGQENLNLIIAANNNSFVGVSIQYRLGAFGFLSSDEVFREGVVNAGILDQFFALQWVQAHISLFGGDPTRVTISGESAGGGSVMLQTMTYGGTMGTSLFKNAIAASPYLPLQYGYKDWIPSQAYYAFAVQAGCTPTTAYGGTVDTIFQCLLKQNTTTLQAASFNVSGSGLFGTWGFLPVTDGVFIQRLPSQQLVQKQVNGLNLLIGNNANEGAPFTPQNINTEDALVAWLARTFPSFTDDDLAKILLYYPSSNTTDDPNATKFATLGNAGPTALNESQVGTGQQQRADNIYAETTFVCPSYWMAESFSDKGRTSYKYQYSVPVATHGADVTGYFGPAAPDQGPDFELAFTTIWGNFITKDNPSISNAVANGASSNNTSDNPASSWPPFNIYAPFQINLNETGGVPFSIPSTGGANVTEFEEPGMTNDITLVNAYTWEGGRGFRCDFWRSMGVIVPE
ncbi:Secreted lipase [Hyphodiscus hymeniophilus]|uniref:Carboxylic ester hydrolase n=1 Tax=Hyphodiscus hymeniophilus TaxID=353542 RepID=A0A9P6VP58_9HELO|nr:Secreted lipase [Hyphodiscus hymeniophilus]